jgi:signal transduction histidine kinase
MMLRACLAASLLSLIATIETAAQAGLPDSIQQMISASRQDTVTVWRLYHAGDNLLNNNPSGARSILRAALAVARKLSFKKGELAIIRSYGSSFFTEDNMDSAMFYASERLQAAKAYGDSLEIGIAYFNKGSVLREQNQLDSALHYSMLGAGIIDGRGDKYVLAQVYNEIGNLYTSRADYNKAITYGKKAVTLARELKNNTLLATSLSNLSRPYAESKRLGPALEYLSEARQLAHALGDLRIEATVLENLGGLKVAEKDFRGAAQYLFDCIPLYRQIGSAGGLSVAFRGIAVTKLQTGDFKTALALADSALAISRANNMERETASVLRVISVIQYAMGNLDAGYQADDESNQVLEKMVNDILTHQSAALEKKFETAQKEAAIKTLQAEKELQQLSIQKKNTYNYILLASAAGLFLLTVLLYRNYRQKQALQQQRIQELEKEKQLLAAEAVLKGEEKERTRLAKDLHDGLGGMLSGIKYSLNTMKGNLIMTPENHEAFERSMDMLDSSIREMRRVAHNMMPEALVKFGLDTALKDFCNDITQSGALKVSYQSFGVNDLVMEQSRSIALYRIIQELLNNSIRHAGASTAIVQLSKTDSILSVTVEDNGNGFDPAILEKSGGMGWTNIRNRVEFMNARLDVNSAAGKGTSVLIEINLP